MRECFGSVCYFDDVVDSVYAFAREGISRWDSLYFRIGVFISNCIEIYDGVFIRGEILNFALMQYRTNEIYLQVASLKII